MDSLCSKILEVHENPKKCCQVLHRSVDVPHDPNMAFESRILLYPKDKYFLTVTKDDAPPNIQGAGNLDATPIVLPQDDQHMGKRMNLNAGGVQVSNDNNLQKSSNNQDAVAGDVPDEVWTKLHFDEVQEMLDFEVEGKQYKIQHHYFTNRKLHLVVNDRRSEMLTAIDVVEYKCDFPMCLPHLQ